MVIHGTFVDKLLNMWFACLRRRHEGIPWLETPSSVDPGGFVRVRTMPALPNRLGAAR